LTGDADLLRVLDAYWDTAVARAGGHLACRPGCTECCLGPFPITALDAARLAAGLAALADSDPARAAAVVERARAADAVVGEPLPEDDDEREAFLTRHAAVPCAALDPTSGQCDLYDHRPVTCRAFGPPVRVGEQLLDPCRLCFTAASSEEIESARLEPDPDDLEGKILATMADGSSETLVALAILRAAGGSV